MKQILLSHNLKLRKDIHKNKMDVLLKFEDELFKAINWFSTLTYHSFLKNERKDIWNRDNLFVNIEGKKTPEEIKLEKKEIINNYITYLDKNFKTFSHKRYYNFILREITSIYSNYNYQFLSYSKFILKNINKKVSDLYNNETIILYKPKTKRSNLNKEDYPLNENVIKKITEKLSQFSISNENISNIINEFTKKYSLLNKIEVDKEFILKYNPEFVFRKYFFREDDSDELINVWNIDELENIDIIGLINKYDLVKYVYNKIKPTYIKVLDISLFNDWVVRRKYWKAWLKDIFDVRVSQKSLFCIDKQIGNQYFIKIINPFNTKEDIKFPIEYNSYIFKSFKGKKYWLFPEKTTMSLFFRLEETPVVKVFNTYDIETKISDNNMINILSYDLWSSNIFAGSVLEFPKGKLSEVKNEFKNIELWKLSHTERSELLKEYFWSEKWKETVKLVKENMKVKKQFLEHSQKAVVKMNKYKKTIDTMKSLRDLDKNNKDFIAVKEKQKQIDLEYKKLNNLKKTIIGNILNKILFNIWFLDHIFLEDLSFAWWKVKKINKITSNILHWKLLRILTYKNKLMNWDLGHISKVLSEFTSTLCNDCWCIDKKNRITQDIFKCINCNNSSQADLNASINIAIFGLIGFIVKDFA